LQKNKNEMEELVSCNRDGTPQCSCTLPFCRAELHFRHMLEQNKPSTTTIIYHQTISEDNGRTVWNSYTPNTSPCLIAELKDKRISYDFLPAKITHVF